MFCQYNDYQSLLLMLLKTKPLITCDVTGIRVRDFACSLAAHPIGRTACKRRYSEHHFRDHRVCDSGADFRAPSSGGSGGGEASTCPCDIGGLPGASDFGKRVEAENRVECSGYGKVLHVLNVKTGKYYAMKVLKKDEIVRRRQVSRTKIERTILEKANFPFITRLYYAYQTPYRLYMVMDYMQCGDLFTHLSHFGLFSEERTRLYVAEIVLALDHLHSMGIIYVRIRVLLLTRREI